MAYYLGYNDSDNLYSINLNIDNAFDILSIVRFTCSFIDEECLKEYLLDEGLIKSGNVKLTYLIDKGKKTNKVCSKLPNISRIFYSEHANSFDINRITLYLNKHLDTNLIRYLLANILRKYGIIGNIKRFLVENLENKDKRNYLTSILKSIIDGSTNIELNIIIQNIIDILKTKDTLSDTEINSFLTFIQSNDSSIVYLYKYLNKQLNMPRLVEIDCLQQLECLQQSYHPNEISREKLINKFINHFIKPNGNRINSRNLVDLGSMIQDYKDYSIELSYRMHRNIMSSYYSGLSQYSTPNSYYSEQDEYIEEEDFGRLGTTSEQEGIPLRQKNSTMWEPGN